MIKIQRKNNWITRAVNRQTKRGKDTANKKRQLKQTSVSE